MLIYVLLYVLSGGSVLIYTALQFGDMILDKRALLAIMGLGLCTYILALLTGSGFIVMLCAVFVTLFNRIPLVLGAIFLCIGMAMALNN